MNIRGFTLVEILVALFVFSLVFLPLTAVLTAESKFERNYERKKTALLVAGNEIEKYKGLDAADDNQEYRVLMAGKTWNVRRSVETAEAVADSAALEKKFVTVSITAENDSVVLAELRVLKETYR